MRGLFAALIALSLNGCNAHQPATLTAEEIQEEARQAEVRRLADQKKQAETYRNIFQPHEICVWNSAKQQLRLISDRSLAVENAFLACLTEEQRMRSYLGVLSLGPGMADALVAKRKLELKQRILAQP